MLFRGLVVLTATGSSNTSRQLCVGTKKNRNKLYWHLRTLWRPGSRDTSIVWWFRPCRCRRIPSRGSCLVHRRTLSLWFGQQSYSTNNKSNTEHQIFSFLLFSRKSIICCSYKCGCIFYFFKVISSLYILICWVTLLGARTKSCQGYLRDNSQGHTFIHFIDLKKVIL